MLAILFVEGKFGLKGVTEDIADAISLYWYGMGNIVSRFSSCCTDKLGVRQSSRGE